MSDTKKTVLILEDDRAARKALGDVFSRAGYTVYDAHSGAEGLPYVENHQIDLIITDLLMPHMDGVTFLQEIRKNPRHAKIPVIVLTNFDSSDTVKEKIAVPSDRYFMKAITHIHTIVDKADTLVG